MQEHFAFIRNSRYKEQIFVVPMSSISGFYFIPFWTTVNSLECSRNKTVQNYVQ